MYEKIPQELKEQKCWVCYTLPDKLPKNPKTGGNAQSNNRSTWSDYNTAVKAVEKYNFNGIGFMFAPPYFGVDLDDASQDLIDEFVETLGSYAETSTSGHGIHIICKGELPQGGRRKDNVEMYCDGRYFIMTGKAISREPYEVTDCTEAIKPLHAKYIASIPIAREPQRVIRLDLSDNEIIDKARNCKSGGVFQMLYSGAWEGAYKSQSEADLAFCNLLAFWCQKDFMQMDRIFRSSGLMRQKWDRKQAGSTYGSITLNKAITGCVDVYQPTKNDAEIVVATRPQHASYVPVKRYNLSDSGNGERFADKFDGQIKYSFVHKKWYYWTSKFWAEDLTGEVRKLADDLIEDMRKEAFSIDDEDQQKEYIKNLNRALSSKGKEALIKEAQHRNSLPVLPQEFDKNIDYFNAQNGVVNLRNGEVMQHSSNLMMSKISNCNIEKGTPERWLKFLSEIMDGDMELVRYLQKAVGYSLSGSTREQCTFFCYGTGSNGKSTFLDIISELLGSYAMNAQPETVMSRQQTAGSTQDIARLQGARFVTTVEPNEGVKLNEGLMKQLTGGDVVTACYKYGMDFEYKPEFKLWMATNHKPIIRGTDNGIWRRIQLIPFTVSIPDDKVDKQLKYKLRRELPQILNWAVEGCILWQKEGLKKPEAVELATKEYRNEMDIMNAFLEECVIITNDETREKASDVFKVYSSWARDNNEWEMSNTRFGKEFSRRFDKKRTNGCIYYIGLRISDEYQDIIFANRRY